RDEIQSAAFTQQQVRARLQRMIGIVIATRPVVPAVVAPVPEFQAAASRFEPHQIWKLAPSLLMRFEPARSRLEFGYRGDYGWYDRSSRDDYANHALQAGAYLLLGERSGLDLVA